MTEELLLRTLQQIQVGLHDLRNEQHEMRVAVSAVQTELANLRTFVDMRLSNLEHRVLRVERHLGITV